MHRYRLPLAAILVGVPLAACAAPDAAAPDVPERTATVELEIGDVNGDGPATFGRIGGLALLSDGAILVIDNDADEARVFGRDGRYRYTFGRAGEGPGEFGGACCPAVDRQGRIWIRNGANARYDVFAPDDTTARFVFSVRMGHADVNFWAPTTFDGRGRIIDIGHRPTDDGLALVKLHIDTAGVIGDSLRIPPTPPDSIGLRIVEGAGGAIRRYLYPPFGPRELIAHGPGGSYARAISSAYRIAWYRADGSLLRVIDSPGHEGPPLSAAEREATAQRLDRDAKRFDLGPSDRFSVPDRKQPLAGLAFDTEGRLWVLPSVSDGAERTAEVRDSTGALLFTARWPADIDPSSSGVLTDSVALAVRTGALDVQSVVRMRWNR